MILLAVFGSPISQSRSPEIHRSFARQCALKVDYRAIEARPETFPRLVEEFTAQGGRGCNVTLPLKNDAWKLGTDYENSFDISKPAWQSGKRQRQELLLPPLADHSNPSDERADGG